MTYIYSIQNCSKIRVYNIKLVSINNLKAQINAKIKLIGQSDFFMSGSFVRKANNGSIAHTVTSKVKGKTK